MRIIVIATAFAVTLGCAKEEEEVSPAVKLLALLAQNAPSSENLEKNVENATKKAEAEVLSTAAPGTPQAVMNQQLAMAKAFAGLGAMNKSGEPVTNWRQLKGFLPDAFGDYKAAGDLDGRSVKSGMFDMTVVKRKYTRGDSRLSVEITDATHVQALMLPFKMAMMINEDSTSGFRKGVRIKGHQGIVSWRESSKRSEAMALVADRYVVKITARRAANSNEALQLMGQIDIDTLAKLKAEAAPQ
jgi:hypothetical protein